MRAILDGDRIVKLCIEGGVEIGKPPKGVGLERLRWDGKKLVDLASLNTIYVTRKNGAIQLHATAKKDAQKVKMKWKDRKKLREENGMFTIAEKVPVIDREKLIKDKLREMAIAELTKEGKWEV